MPYAQCIYNKAYSIQFMHDSHCVIVYSCYFHTGDFTKKYNAARKGQLPSNPNAPSTKLVEHSNVLKKFENKINLGPFESSTLSHSSVSSLEVLCRKTAAVKIRSKDKSDRATAEQVLDPRTRMIYPSFSIENTYLRSMDV